MKLFDNRGAFALPKKKMIILLGTVLGVALIAWGLLMVMVFGKGKLPKLSGKDNRKETHIIPDGYKEIYQLKKVLTLSEDGDVIESLEYEFDECGRIASEKKEKKEKVLGYLGYAEQEKEESLYTYEYNSDGKLIKKTQEHTRYFTDGDTLYWWKNEEYVYDAKGVLIEETVTTEDQKDEYWYNYNLDGKKTTDVEHHKNRSEGWGRTTFYNDEGNPLRTYSYDDGQQWAYTLRLKNWIEQEWFYSDEGLLIEEDEYIYTSFGGDERSFYVQKTIYEYDSSGKMIRKKLYSDEELLALSDWSEEGKALFYDTSYAVSDEGTLYLKEEQWLNEKGEVVRSRKYNPYGLKSSENEYELDENGFVTKDLYYSCGEFSQWLEYEYNDPSLKVWTVMYKKNENGTVFLKTEREFFTEADGTILLVKYLTYDANGERNGYYGYYYTFDKNGNPRMRITIVDGKEYISETREYERFLIPVE